MLYVNDQPTFGFWMTFSGLLSLDLCCRGYNVFLCLGLSNCQ